MATVDLSAYALLSEAEFLVEVGGSGSAGNDHRSAINDATFRIEEHLGRKLISRGAITEYVTLRDEHDAAVSAKTLFLAEWPLIALTSVHETTSKTYDATTLLTENTDFLVESTVNGTLTRLCGDSTTTWDTSHRAIKLVYTAGYATAAAVPEVIRAAGRKLAARIYQEQSNKEWGTISKSDGMGSATRTAPAGITKDIAALLYPYTGPNRPRFGTYE